MKKIKLVTLIFCALFMMMLCSCKEVTQSYAQELTKSMWSEELENGTQVTLEFFEDNKAQLNIKGDCDNTCTISGICVIDEKTIIISDKSMAKNISVDYRLFGNKVELTYLGETITLFKIEENADNSNDENTDKTQNIAEANSHSGS